jgi:hypothetical protein
LFYLCGDCATRSIKHGNSGGEEILKNGKFRGDFKEIDKLSGFSNKKRDSPIFTDV